jgi:transposase
MKSAQYPLHVGADVAKDEIVVACAEQSFTPRKIANTRIALQAWLKTLPGGSHIGMEATGTHHELLAELAHKLGFTVYVLNPKDVRHYAKGVGQRAKTDRVDAQLIARFVANEHSRLHPFLPPTPEQRQIDRLLKRRTKLTRIRGALKQSLKGLSGFSSELNSLVARLDALIKRIDAKIGTLIEASPESQEAHARLQRIPGVGPVVGSGVLNSLQRVPFSNADAFVAFCGWDPRPDDSGRKSGRRRLSKRGSSQLRYLLYNAAMAASRTKAWRPFYDRALAKGLSRIEALVILARQIARTAWSIYTHKTQFDPQRISQPIQQPSQPLT